MVKPKNYPGKSTKFYSASKEHWKRYYQYSPLYYWPSVEAGGSPIGIDSDGWSNYARVMRFR